jgi:hypothetical protein
MSAYNRQPRKSSADYGGKTMAGSILERIQSFKDCFKGYEDNFVIIGGTACSLIMNEEAADFRATKDIDIVLLIEALNPDFGRQFWGYVKDSGYRHCQKSTGRPQFYRFYAPAAADRPEMIELFSRHVDDLKLPDDAVVTPIPVGGDISSLSAILLNDDYYYFLRNGVRKIDGLPVLDELYMIPFKAKAWLDLTERRSRGESVDSNDIRKHKRDVYKLAGIVRDGFKFSLPAAVESDMRMFIAVTKETQANLSVKERKAEQTQIEKVAAFFGLQAVPAQEKTDTTRL